MPQEKIPSHIYQISFNSDDINSLMTVTSVLIMLGYSKNDIIEHDDLGRKSLRMYFNSKAEVERLKLLFKNLKLEHISIRSVLMRPKDWASRWKKNWRPARLTDLLDVVPLWCYEKYKKINDRDYILLDTLLSFGSGLHETTQIVSQMIEDKREQIRSFLDIGTGTGILTIVALKHGARRVLALDIGDLSVKAAKDNLKVNHFKASVIKADISKYKNVKTYDFVAANLVTQDLVKFQRRITACVKPGGYLAVSGISLLNCPFFESGFKGKSFIKLQTIKAKEWAGYLYQKKM